MKIAILFLNLTICSISLSAQTTDSIEIKKQLIIEKKKHDELEFYARHSSGDSAEVIKGPEKYKNEVIQIVTTYSKIRDSITNDWIAKMSKDSLYSEKERKARPKKYRGYDGGYGGYLMSEEYGQIQSIINSFLKIDRISSSSVASKGKEPTIYTFYYYRTEKTADGGTRSISGKVIWTDKE